jgi:aspartate/methionine/tyrosine aminotransferase
MRFDQDRYLEWYVPRFRGADPPPINLHASGVAALTPADLPSPAEGDPWGHPARFEEALGAWLEIPAAEVLFTPGATGGNLLASLALADAGAELLVEAPIYEPMVLQAARIGPLRRLERRASDGWVLTAEAARQVREETGLIVITEPHNPSGRFSPRAAILALAEAAAEVGASVLINEVYLGYSDRPSYHGIAPNVVVVSSLSKLLGAYWARLGWLSGGAAVIERLRWAHVNMGMPASPAAATGLAVLRRADALRAVARQAAHGPLPMVDEWVRGTPGISWSPPEGPGFGCVELPPGTDDMALADTLLEDAGVLVIPGTLFEAPGTLRLSWLQAGERLAEGLDALARVIP